jgi:hypothetical protein
MNLSNYGKFSQLRVGATFAFYPKYENPSLCSPQLSACRRCAPGVGADAKGSLQFVQKLGGHSLGAVAITAFHNPASDVRNQKSRTHR